MQGTQGKDVKSAARDLVDSLPNGATWDDLMYRVYVRQAIDAGRHDAAEGRLVEVAEVRRVIHGAQLMPPEAPIS